MVYWFSGFMDLWIYGLVVLYVLVGWLVWLVWLAVLIGCMNKYTSTYVVPL